MGTRLEVPFGAAPGTPDAPTPRVSRRRSARWERRYREHYDRVVTYAYRLSGRARYAHRLTQAAFSYALPRVEGLDDPDALAYILASVRNLHLSSFRRAVAISSTAEVPLSALEPRDPDPERTLLVHQLQHHLRLANALIAPEARLALALRELEGRSYSDIGRMLGETEEDTGRLIATARAGLRRQLHLGSGTNAELARGCPDVAAVCSAFLDGRIVGRDALRIHRHIEACDDCRRLTTGERQAGAAIRSLTLPPGFRISWRGVLAGIPGMSVPSSSWREASAAQVALVIVLLVGVIVVGLSGIA
ncbi:MAG: hypothetical protein HYX33_03385 [Actinobacteria bacterium]|nr:hypothetical protein [Actinomycetota bacterium]